METTKPKSKVKKGCIIAASIPMAIIGLFLIIVLIGTSVEKCKPVPHPPKKSEVALYAPLVAEQAVKKLLIAPSTAEFPSEGREVFAYVTDSTAVVNGYVDAQNGFGAMIRTPYHVKLKYTGPVNDPNNWFILESQLIE